MPTAVGDEKKKNMHFSFSSRRPAEDLRSTANGKNNISSAGGVAGGGPPRSHRGGGGDDRTRREDVWNVRQDPSRSRHFSGRTPAGERPRGYVKLSDAAKAFSFDFRGKTVLDIGSSTGGFTQYALDHGARKVIAVEKGTNQMAKPLRHDPRVDLHEKTDIFDFKLSDEINTVVADISFISLKPVLKYIRQKNVDYLVMLKPQFEARTDQLNKGVVKNDKIRRAIIKDFEQWLKNNGYLIINKYDNALKGKSGNQERFYHLVLAK